MTSPRTGLRVGLRALPSIEPGFTKPRAIFRGGLLHQLRHKLSSPIPCFPCFIIFVFDVSPSKLPFRLQHGLALLQVFPFCAFSCVYPTA